MYMEEEKTVGWEISYEGTSSISSFRSGQIFGTTAKEGRIGQERGNHPLRGSGPTQ
jgi:hypothetical protein